jgi:hypothetical protein
MLSRVQRYVAFLICSLEHTARSSPGPYHRRLVPRVTTAARRTFVVGTDAGLKRNKYHSVLEGEFPLVCGGSLPEVHIEWEQWVRPMELCAESACGLRLT